MVRRRSVFDRRFERESVSSDRSSVYSADLKKKRRRRKWRVLTEESPNIDAHRKRERDKRVEEEVGKQTEGERRGERGGSTFK
jgi:hypothetical protein